MKNTHRLKTLLVLTAILGAGAAWAAPGKPNIIFVLADDISAKDLRCYNPAGIELPTLGKMAREGVMSESAWSAPVCGPSRAIPPDREISVQPGLF